MIDAQCINILAADKEVKIEHLNFINRAIFLVETPNEKTNRYVFRPGEIFGIEERKEPTSSRQN